MRRAAVLAINDPISLQIFLDSNGTANGVLYLDDGESFKYRTNNAFIYGRFSYGKRMLSYIFEKGDPNSNQAWLERVTIIGFPSKPNRILLVSDINNKHSANGNLAFKYDSSKHILTVRKPAVSFGTNWQIKIN